MTAQELKAAILDLAIRGKLVPQDPADEPAEKLLERIAEVGSRVPRDRKSATRGRAGRATLPPISDEEKPFDLPKGWAWCRLGGACDVLAGYAFDSRKFVPDGIRVCGGLIIMPDGITWKKCKYWGSTEGLSEFLLDVDDVVVALDRTWISEGAKVGLIKKEDLPCLLIQRTARIRSSIFVPHFLRILLKSDLFKKHCTTTGITVPHISHKDIVSFSVAIPPLAEQKRIVTRIEELMPWVERYGQAEEKRIELDIALPGQLKQAILKAAFAGTLMADSVGVEKSLDSVCAGVFTGNSLSDLEKRKFTRPDGLPFVGTKDVGFDQVIAYDNGIRIPKSEGGYRIAPKGATLLCVEGGSSGRKIGLLTEDVRFGNKLCAFVPGESLDSRYLFLYLQSPQFQEQFAALQNGPRKGAGVSQVKELTIPMLALTKQQQLVERIALFCSKIRNV